MPLVRKLSKSTLTGVELNPGEILEFALTSGAVWRLEVHASEATILETTLTELRVEVNDARTLYQMAAEVSINGHRRRLVREIGTDRTFCEPWEIDGVCVWLDAVDKIFDFVLETHGECRPAKAVRLALWEPVLGVCPEPLHPWCPLPAGGLRMAHCYRGEDCWLGAYNGASAHGGLDINHPRCTPLWAPLLLHDQFYFNSLEMGHNNNRWRAVHRWSHGPEWILQAHHMTRLTVAEHQLVVKGGQFADGAGVLSGAHEHSHFVFKVHDEGETVMLDPWLLFRQMYEDAGEPFTRIPPLSG